MLSEHPGDSQQVELLGRNRLIDELLRDNLEVAMPIRDRGIDLIASADSGEDVTTYSARPIQMKASWTRGFGLYRKYEKFPDLLIAYVWHLNDRDKGCRWGQSYILHLAAFFHHGCNGAGREGPARHPRHQGSIRPHL